MARIPGGANQQRVYRGTFMRVDADINIIHFLNAFNIALAGNYRVRNTRHIELIFMLGIIGYSVSVLVDRVQVRKYRPQKAFVVFIADIHKAQFGIA